MVEDFFWKLLILLVTTFASPSAFGASYYLLMKEFSDLLLENEVITILGIENIFYGVSNIPIVLITLWQTVNVWVMLVAFMLIVVLLIIYTWWMDQRGKVWLESRRLHKSIAAMEIVFAFILIYAGYLMIRESMVITLYSSIIIFILSLIVMLKWGQKIPMIVYFLIAILITYFLM